MLYSAFIMLSSFHTKGPYPLGDFGKIGAIIGIIIAGRLPIIVPATSWVWSKIAG